MNSRAGQKNAENRTKNARTAGHLACATASPSGHDVRPDKEAGHCVPRTCPGGVLRAQQQHQEAAEKRLAELIRSSLVLSKWMRAFVFGCNGYMKRAGYLTQRQAEVLISTDSARARFQEPASC